MSNIQLKHWNKRRQNAKIRVLGLDAVITQCIRAGKEAHKKKFKFLAVKPEDIPGRLLVQAMGMESEYKRHVDIKRAAIEDAVVIPDDEEGKDSGSKPRG